MIGALVLPKGVSSCIHACPGSDISYNPEPPMIAMVTCSSMLDLPILEFFVREILSSSSTLNVENGFSTFELIAGDDHGGGHVFQVQKCAVC